MIAGDSHASWVSDLIWLDEHSYDQQTGQGSIGVEFAGTAVSSPSPAGQNITIQEANNASDYLIGDNRELQWSELYYRGYFELSITHDAVNAHYFGLPTNANRHSNELSLANFTVRSGVNALERTPKQVVENGKLRYGTRVQTKVINDTETGAFSSASGH